MISDLSVLIAEVECGTLPKAGCQDFTGSIPSIFLDKRNPFFRITFANILTKIQLYKKNFQSLTKGIVEHLNKPPILEISRYGISSTLIPQTSRR